MRRGAVLALIGLGLVIVIGAFVSAWWLQEAGRPRLAEVRVVTASQSDPTFRDRPRTLGPDEPFRLAVAMRLEQRGEEPYWIAPVERLELGGSAIAHRRVDGWPESDRRWQVWWSTVESERLSIPAERIREPGDLVYRLFPAPELGRDATAEGHLDPHNDDFLADEASTGGDGPGTLRFHARVEIVGDEGDRLQSVGSVGASDPVRSATVHRLADIEGIDRHVGALFLLPCAPGSPERPELLHDLVAARLATTPGEIVATAAGAPGDGDGVFRQRAGLRQDGAAIVSEGGRLRWGPDVRAGDVLELGGLRVSLVGDDGDGVLTLGDRGLWCGAGPARVAPLLEALGHRDPAGDPSLRLLRLGDVGES